MRRSNLAEILFLTAVIGLAIAVVVMSRDFSFRAFLLPIVGAVPAALLAIYQLVMLATGKDKGGDRPESSIDYTSVQEVEVEGSMKAESPGTAADSETLTESAPVVRETLAPHWWSFAWLAVLVGLVYYLGLAVGALIFTVLYMRIRAKDEWRRIAIVAASVGLILYGLVTVLGARIYAGLVF